MFVGLKVATWTGRKVSNLAQARNVDVALSRFIGNIVKLVVIAFVVVITLGNFGISIAPLIALAGASAFGATMALHGPLSNYGAGLAILLGRPFSVGDTITVSFSRRVVSDQCSTFFGKARVRFWLEADIHPHSDLRPLYPRKQTYRDPMSAPGAIADHLQSGDRRPVMTQAV